MQAWCSTLILLKSSCAIGNRPALAVAAFQSIKWNQPAVQAIVFAFGNTRNWNADGLISIAEKTFCFTWGYFFLRRQVYPQRQPAFQHNNWQDKPKDTTFPRENKQQAGTKAQYHMNISFALEEQPGHVVQSVLNTDDQRRHAEVVDAVDVAVRLVYQDPSHSRVASVQSDLKHEATKGDAFFVCLAFKLKPVETRSLSAEKASPGGSIPTLWHALFLF